MNAPNQSTPLHADLPRTSGSAFYALILLGVAGAAGVFVLGYLPKARQRESVREITRELAVIRVRTALPAPGANAVALTLPAELKPAIEASILARVSGYVRVWHADIGDSVKAGQVLAELDTPELEREIGRAEAQLALATAAHKLSETTAKRWQELFAAKTASSQETDEKQADLELKKAALGTALAELERLRQIASFSKITAPFDGVVTARRLDLGQLVEAGGAKELFRLSQISRLRVFVRVPQAYALGIKTEQTAELTLTEMRGKVIPAKVVRTAGAIEPASRTLLVELEADNSIGLPLAGSFAQIRFPSTDVSAPLTVPANSLIFRSEGAQLATVNQSGTVEMKAATLGRDFGNTVEITEGVLPTDRVILNPPDSIASGVPVEVVE